MYEWDHFSLHSVSVLLAPIDAVGRTTDPADEFLLSPSEYTSIKVQLTLCLESSVVVDPNTLSIRPRLDC